MSCRSLNRRHPRDPPPGLPQFISGAEEALRQLGWGQSEEEKTPVPERQEGDGPLSGPALDEVVPSLPRLFRDMVRRPAGNRIGDVGRGQRESGQCSCPLHLLRSRHRCDGPSQLRLRMVGRQAPAQTIRVKPKKGGDARCLRSRARPLRKRWCHCWPAPCSPRDSAATVLGPALVRRSPSIVQSVEVRILDADTPLPVTSRTVPFSPLIPPS